METVAIHKGVFDEPPVIAKVADLKLIPELQEGHNIIGDTLYLLTYKSTDGDDYLAAFAIPSGDMQRESAPNVDFLSDVLAGRQSELKQYSDNTSD